MTNEIGFYSPQPAAALPRKEQPESRKADAVNVVEKPDRGEASAEAPVSARSSEGQPSQDGLEQTVEDLNSLVQDLQREVRFSLDNDSGEMVVKVVDRQTDDVIRQIPSAEVLELRDRLEQATGAIFKDSA